MRPPMNMTPDETEIWQRMEQHGEELVRDMGAALLQADRLPEWMKGIRCEHAVRQAGGCQSAGCQLDERPRGAVKGKRR